MPGAAGTMPGAAGIGTVGGPLGVPTVIVPGPDQGPARMISRVPPRSSATESVFSTNTSNPEPLETRDALGRPLRLPLRPLGNQPGFDFATERDFLLMRPAPEDAARAF